MSFLVQTSYGVQLAFLCLCQSLWAATTWDHRGQYSHAINNKVTGWKQVETLCLGVMYLVLLPPLTSCHVTLFQSIWMPHSVNIQDASLPPCLCSLPVKMQFIAVLLKSYFTKEPPHSPNIISYSTFTCSSRMECNRFWFLHSTLCLIFPGLW